MKEFFMAEKILIVDDEQEIADLVELYLKNENYKVFKFYTAHEAVKCIEETDLDLAILDIMLPGVSGLSICQKIRETHTYPIIMLTAKDAETDKITGLTLGADDYITKPFLPLELVARVKAQLRRYKKYSGEVAKPDSGVIVHAGLVIDSNSREVLLNERPLALTPTEFAILRILCENKGNVVSSEQLFHEIWGDEYFSKNNNTITVHIRHLRKKMGDTMDNPKYIKTVWGVGYKIEK
jgi:two-component system response regulator VanR